MTYFDKLKQDHPEIHTPDDVSGCPHDYGYDHEVPKGCAISAISCYKCWQRVIPEEKETYSHEEIKMMCDIADDVVERFNEATGEHGPKIRINPEWVANVQESVINSIKDSGDRTQFATGAVRDMHEGKGRCDLLPLDVVGMVYGVIDDDCPACAIFKLISRFQGSGNVIHLLSILFNNYMFDCSLDTMFLEVAKHFEDGAKKYGEYNWQKGIPVNCYIDSAVRHYLKYLRGDEDERHDRAFVWNILCCIWTCKHKPELNCYLKEKENV